MPVEVIWDDDAQTIIRQIYSGHLVLQDFFTGTDALLRMANSVTYPVHTIYDRTQVDSTPAMILPALRYVNSRVPPNLRLRIIVKPVLFTRVIIELAQKIAPRVVENLYFVETLEEARRMIASQPPSK
jgi:hypothetical protein